MTIYYLIGLGTADEYVKAKVIERLDLYERILGGGEEARDLKNDLAMLGGDEKTILADLRAAILRGEVLPEYEDEVA